MFDCYDGTLVNPDSTNLDLPELQCEKEELCEGEHISKKVEEFQEMANISIYWQKDYLPKVYRIECFDIGEEIFI